MSRIELPGGYSIADFISFTDEIYFRLFERQFEAWWPLHLLMLLLGVAILVLAWRGKTRVAAFMLAIPFATSALTFQLPLYAELTPVGQIFGWGFLVQIALILIWAFFTQSHESFQPRVHTVTGLGIALIALAVYPLLDLWAERGWQGAAYFGMAPDPTVCFFFGFVLICARPLWCLLLLPIPLLWAVTSAATLDSLEAPFAANLAMVAAVTVAAMVWKAVFCRQSDSD